MRIFIKKFLRVLPRKICAFNKVLTILAPAVMDVKSVFSQKQNLKKAKKAKETNFVKNFEKNLHFWYIYAILTI